MSFQQFRFLWTLLIRQLNKVLCQNWWINQLSLGDPQIIFLHCSLWCFRQISFILAAIWVSGDTNFMIQFSFSCRFFFSPQLWFSTNFFAAHPKYYILCMHRAVDRTLLCGCSQRKCFRLYNRYRKVFSIENKRSWKESRGWRQRAIILICSKRKNSAH